MAASRPVVVSHDPAWARRASVLIAELHKLLAPYVLRLEHIGSTSVAGMAAKNVIDLQVSVADLETAAQAFDGPLLREGFRRLPYEHDHIPAGIDDDPARWAKRFWSRRCHASSDVNLHARRAGSPNERVALLFRDWLRAHPGAVAAYSSLKRSLAAAVTDLDTYAELKNPAVDLVIAAAEPWASATGWN